MDDVLSLLLRVIALLDRQNDVLEQIRDEIREQGQPKVNYR